MVKDRELQPQNWVLLLLIKAAEGKGLKQNSQSKKLHLIQDVIQETQIWSQ